MGDLCVLFLLSIGAMMKLAFGERISEVVEGLIANGVPYDKLDYPYLVAISIKLDSGFLKGCTGSLMTPLFVLTAAHCTENIVEKQITVFSGTMGNKERQREVEKIYQHQDYATFGLADIAVLKLKSPFDDILRFITIAGHPNEFADGAAVDCKSMGFGKNNEKGDLDRNGCIIDVKLKYGAKACLMMKPDLILADWEVYLCPVPSNKMSCMGDSGGPVVCRGFQYGTVSSCYNHVIENGTTECGSDNTQSTHVFNFVYRKWIIDIVHEDVQKKRHDNPSIENLTTQPCIGFQTIFLVLALYTLL